MTFEISYKPFGEQAILIEWPKQITESILKDLLGFKEKINRSEAENISEVRSAYQSLLIVYNTDFSFKKEVSLLEHIYKSEAIISSKTSKTWYIPVCYDDDFGLDLKSISESKKIPQSEIIQRHSQVLYTVYFIGFLPGFLYLGGLDEKLISPRKATPRQHIEKGAVAIGGNQTGVYPTDSPGGWNIIGKTPISFFDSNTDMPCFAEAGDQIQFYGVSLIEFNDIKVLVDAEVYQIESEAHVG